MCYTCGEKGHISPNCPKRQTAQVKHTQSEVEKGGDKERDRSVEVSEVMRGLSEEQRKAFTEAVLSYRE